MVARYGLGMRVEAAIVSYNPSRPLLRLVNELIAAGITVEIIDNASSSGGAVLDQCVAAGATLTSLDTNTGVAGALDLALRHSTADWLLTLDQDSRVSAPTLDKLIKSAATKSARVAIVAPLIQDETTAQLLQGNPDKSDWYETERVLTSGSLCRVQALNQVGGFRKDLVIDFVDWELCLRLREAGWQIAIEPTAILEHSIGNQTLHQVPLLGEIRTTNHNADRQYYKYRNYLLLARSGQLTHDPKWSLRTALGLGLGVGKVLMLEGDKKAKLKAIAVGTVDGLAGRSGVREQPLKTPPETTVTPSGHPRTLISVCMATYNGSRYLRRQLDSILAQLGTDDELLLQDDSSTDDTVAIIASYDDPRISLVVNEANQGVIATFELCLARAKKPIVFLSDQDDEWLQGKVDAMVAQFDDPKVTCVITDAQIVDASDQMTGESIFAHLHSGPGVMHNFVKNTYLGCCMAIRRDVLKIALPVPHSVRTHDGWIGITADMLGKVVFLPTPYVNYRRHDSNVSQMERFGLADIARRRLALATHLARITPSVLKRRSAPAR